jgi:adenine C2-methylase RlmN of 23S rRNA A2503 and tRNA A37
VGRIDGIEKLAALNMPKLNLTVSLNAPNDRLRGQLMPFHEDGSLALLQKALMGYPLKKGNVLNVAYVLISKVNDKSEHAEQLAEWLKPSACQGQFDSVKSRQEFIFSGTESGGNGSLSKAAHRIATSMCKNGCRAAGTLMAACGQLGSREDLGEDHV